jgi:transposase-like protein
VDETPIKVDRGWGALYRALAREGHLLDVRLSEPRDLPAARALSRSARPSTTGSPLRVTTDRHGSYPGAIRQWCQTLYPDKQLLLLWDGAITIGGKTCKASSPKRMRA